MVFAKCPRCEAYAFETLETYGVCYDCNYNTVENENDRPITVAKNDFEKAWDKYERLLIQNRFTKTDRAIIRGAIEQLTRQEQAVVFLKFWEGQNTVSIANILKTKPQAVLNLLDSAFLKLKNLCLSRPAFSRSPEHLKFLLGNLEVA
ncbi:MAG: hypothetical protein AB7F43_01940 [Bacteriovoracia bacterium]